MGYIQAGIHIAVGGVLALVILNIIYCALCPLINRIYWKIIKKAKNFRKRFEEEPPEPTVCEKLGPPTIFTHEDQIIQKKRRNFLSDKERALILIDFIFPKPQITYNKFYYDIERLQRAFDKQYNSLHLYLRAYPDHDIASHDVITQGMDNLNKFTESLEDLIKELSSLIVCDRETDTLINDLKNETESVKKYEKVV